MCDRQEQLVALLYDDIEPAERHHLLAHLESCGACRAEMEELRGARMLLGSWAPPQPDLGFRVISGSSAPAPALPRRMRLAPAFAFAAAAVIVLAVASAIANIEVRYGSDGMTVRTGWARAGQGSAPSALSEPVAAPAGVTDSDVAALAQRLRAIESALAAAPASAVATAGAPGRSLSDAELIRRVRDIIGESDAQQQAAFTQIVLQAVRDFEKQRRIDLAALQQGIGQYQGLTNAEMVETRNIVNQLMRVATRQEKE